MANGDTSDLESLIYGGAWILPEKDSFNEQDPTGVVRSSGGVGPLKSQLQFVNAHELMSVTYVALSNSKINFIKRFLKENRGQYFLAMLPNKYGEIVPRPVQYLDDQPSFKKTGFNGSVTLQYQAEPDDDVCFDEFLMWSGQCWGDDACAIMSLADDGVKALPGEGNG